MEGLLYLHNLAGNALAKANADLEALRARIAELETTLAERPADESGVMPHQIAGNALAKAEADMAALREENRQLREALAERDAGEPDEETRAE